MLVTYFHDTALAGHFGARKDRFEERYQFLVALHANAILDYVRKT
jgi:hypothetical protein